MILCSPLPLLQRRLPPPKCGCPLWKMRPWPLSGCCLCLLPSSLGQLGSSPGTWGCVLKPFRGGGVFRGQCSGGKLDKRLRVPCPKSNATFRKLTRNIEENKILKEKFRVVSRFPSQILFYISENRLPLGQSRPLWRSKEKKITMEIQTFFSNNFLSFFVM